MFDLIGRAYAKLPDLPGLKVVPPGTDAVDTFKDIVAKAIGLVLIIAGAIAVLYLIYGGIEYITAGGDPEKATKGRTAIVNAIIGIVIIALAYLIVAVVANALGGVEG